MQRLESAESEKNLCCSSREFMLRKRCQDSDSAPWTWEDVNIDTYIPCCSFRNQFCLLVKICLSCPETRYVNHDEVMTLKL